MLLLSVPIGLAAGLLVNYLADVLPLTRTLSSPVWLSNGGFAKYLRSPRVLLVFAFYLAAAIYVWQNPPLDYSPWLFYAILVYFGLVTVIDIEHRIVMHPVSIAGALAMGAIGILRHGLPETLVAAAAGFSLMLGLYFAGDLLGRGLARLRGEPWGETALGFGDVNLAAVIGLLMGWPGVLVALILGIALAGVYSLGFVLVSLVRGSYRMFAAIPYAPFLCIATVGLIAFAIYV